MTDRVAEPEVVDFFSPSLRMRLPVWTWVPPGPGPFPLLVLLHGAHDSGGHGWWRWARAHETVAALRDAGLAHPPVLLMPPDTGTEHATGWVDWADGSTAAESFVTRELLPWAATDLPVDGRRWVTGLSMGGYAALLLALRNPGLFDSASAMSGFFDPDRLADFVPDHGDRIWGDRAGRDAHNVSRLVEVAERRTGLRIAFDCGSEDGLVKDGQLLHEHLDRLGVNHGWAVHPGGHDWDYWSKHLSDHILFHAGEPGPLG